MWSVVGIVCSYILDGLMIEYRLEQERFVFSQTTRRALVLNHPPIDWESEDV
jgi:hypothetical protein